VEQIKFIDLITFSTFTLIFAKRINHDLFCITKTSMKQSEIWLINLDPTIRAEIKKTRPAIIVNDDALGKLPLKIIVRITRWRGFAIRANKRTE